MKGIIGKKLGMTQVYDDKGVLSPVTVIEAGPCPVTELRTAAKNGYSSIQLGFGSRKAKNAGKPIVGHVAKSGMVNPPSSMSEIRLDKDSDLKVGDIVRCDIFSSDEFVDVIGVTKGKGFQGVVRRYNFKGGRASHGGGWHRRPGSIGCKEKPGNIIKGKKMPGHLGHSRRTIQNLKVIKVQPEDNLLFIKGAVPGPEGGVIIIKSALKKAPKN